MKVLSPVAVIAFALVVATALVADAQDRSSTVERLLDIASLMKASGIPGMSVAVIYDYKIVWAEGYGVIEKDGSTPVTSRLQRSLHFSQRA